MTTIGTPVKDSILIDHLYDYAGVGYAEVKITCWDDVERLPAALTVEGRVYGYSAWNSDRMLAYYRTDRVFALRMTTAEGTTR